MTSTTAIRTGGLALTLGSVTWAVTMLVAGPPVDEVSPTLEILGGFAYQLGLAGFLLAAWVTRALGDSRGARIVLRGEAVLLALASVWSVVYVIDPSTMDSLTMAVLDVTWPLSMLGLVPVGVYILRAGVWTSPARYLPLIASLWLPLDIMATVIGGDSAGLAFRTAWLAVVWGGLGLLIARGPADADSVAPHAASATARQSGGVSA
ncbi:MAG: hypothetical protein M3486_01900 [Actinomycetota bacterium]|nr:hypothetical protein [Actinomycetota bacterium]